MYCAALVKLQKSSAIIVVVAIIFFIFFSFYFGLGFGFLPFGLCYLYTAIQPSFIFIILTSFFRPHIWAPNPIKEFGWRPASLAKVKSERLMKKRELLGP